MSSFKCFLSALVAFGVLFTSNAQQEQFPCRYQYFKEAEGWFKIHLDRNTWSQAERICYLEGASLASPATHGMKDAMMSLMYFDEVNDSLYQYSNPSIIHTAMYPTGANEVEPQALGLTNEGNLVEVSQYDSLPYICYKNSPEVLQLNECGTIGNGYALDNRTEHCYKFHRNRLNWFEAADNCSAEGGHLAIINSEVEVQVIQDIFADNPADFISGWAWKDSAFLGFRANKQKKWITVQEQTLANAGYEGWAPGEPNNARGDEYCGSVGRNGRLYDDPCSRELPYICEKKMTNVCRKKTSTVIVLSPRVKTDVLRNLMNGLANQ